MARLLLVDDDPDILESLTLSLEGEHTIETATDGEEALARLSRPESVAIDLVVLDLMMPHMSGMELVQELRARGIEVPIILTSAMHDVAERALALGAAAHFDKPYRLRALRHAIVDALKAGEPEDGLSVPARDLDRGRLVRGAHCSRRTARATRAPCRTNEQRKRALPNRS
jgi:DNA-binding response OmpR family regulator